MTVHFDRVERAEPVKLSGGFAKDRNKGNAYAAGGKRALDLALIAIFLPVIAGLLLVLTAGLILSGQKPFFVQERVGRNGRVFRMIKFRTMVDNAAERLTEYLDANPDARAEWERDQKLKKDPRITPVGQFLRKSSLDELPQIINVIKGDMSLVGPRPMMVEQRAMYPGDDYYRVRPGITGPWQISERNDCGFRDRAEFDAQYARRLSLHVDLSILAATVAVVLRGTGY